MNKRKNIAPLIIISVIGVLLIGTLSSLFIFKTFFNGKDKNKKQEEIEKTPINDISVIDRSLVLYEDVQIKYKGNGATSGSTKSHICSSNSNCTIKNNGFKKKGYIFVGWTTNKDGTDDNYGWTDWSGTWKYTNDQYGIENNTLTLYAMWEKVKSNKIIIIYHGNGASAGWTSRTICKSNTPCAFKSSDFVKVGYAFKGWTTNKDGNDDTFGWTDWNGVLKEEYKKYGFVNNVMHLYARWEKIDKNTFTIQYHGNGATDGNVVMHTCVYDQEKPKCTIKSNSFINNGYKFLGWTTNKDGTDDGHGWTNWSGIWKYTNGQFGISNNELHLYARWGENKTYKASIVADPNKTLTISPSRVYLKFDKNSSVDLKATLPANVGNKTITWKSSNSKMVQVDKKTGKTTAYNEDYIETTLLGDAIVTASTQDGYQGIVRVTVTSLDITVDKASKKFIINDKESKSGIRGTSSFNIQKEYDTCNGMVNHSDTYKKPDNFGTNKKKSTADKIHFIDVGRGDATLIESNGKYGLIDVGYDEEDAYNYIGSILKGKKLSFVMLTHWHEDHVGGLYDIIREQLVDSNTVFYFNKPAELTTNNSSYYKLYCNLFVRMRDLINSDNNIRYVTNKGDISFKLGDMDIQILENNFPDGYYPDESDEGKLTNENRNSIGALITYKDKTRVLITGDMGESDEYRIAEKLSSQGISKIQIYKMGHHGATTAAYTPFIDYIEPKYVVIANSIDSVRPHGNENLSTMCYMQYMYNSKLYLTGNTKKISITKNNNKVKIKGSIVYNFEDKKFYNSNTTNKLKANQYPLNLCTKNDTNGVRKITYSNATDEYKDKTCDLYFEYGTFIDGTRDGKRYAEEGTPSKDYYRAPGRICY